MSHTGQPIGLIAVIGRRPLTNRTVAESMLKMVAIRAARNWNDWMPNRNLNDSTMNSNSKIKRLESIIGIASHDLRSPLINIKGFSGVLTKDINKLEQMLKGEQISQNVREKADMVFNKYIPDAVGFIRNGADFINQMLQGLMKVAKAGIIPLAVHDIDMNALLKKIVANVQFKLQESGGEPEVEPLPGCRGDSDQITQVFNNLVENAIKYRDSARPCKISIYASAEPNKVTYCVEDNGKGIALEHLDKVFNLFARLDPEAAKGEGLGLTIAKRMVERQGGKIWVNSEVGKGSKFFVGSLALNALKKIESDPV